MANDSESYECSSGLILPIFDESKWATWLRAVLYLVAMLYTFLGISIAADVFMLSIEKITSKTKTVRIEDKTTKKGYHEVTVQVWNATVANLTLMALGSSAPEILLSIIEIVGNNFEAGELGPSTIVGSAAFNLLIIIGVCIVSIPGEESRRINAIAVFAVTASAAVLAYVWLVIVVSVSSKNEIEIWEATVTLLFFVLLVVLAFLADKKTWKRHRSDEEFVEEIEIVAHSEKSAHSRRIHAFDSESLHAGTPRSSVSVVGGHTFEDEFEHEAKEMLRKNRDISSADIALRRAMKIEKMQPHSKMYYRLMATGWIVASTVEREKMVEKAMSKKSTKVAPERPLSALFAKRDMEACEFKDEFIFAATKYTFMQEEQTVNIQIDRVCIGKPRTIHLKIETVEASANAYTEFEPINEMITFEQSEMSKTIPLKILSVIRSSDEADTVSTQLYLKMSKADSLTEHVVFDNSGLTKITLTNLVVPKMSIEFRHKTLVFEENVGRALIPIVFNGAQQITQELRVEFETRDVTAENGRDYIGGHIDLTFGKGESEKMLPIEIIDDIDFEKHEAFDVFFVETSLRDVKYEPNSSLRVIILSDDQLVGKVNRAKELVPRVLEEMRPTGLSSWCGQFHRAANVNEGDVTDASLKDYAWHFCSFFWKMVFACAPPVFYCGGWLTFFVALALIGLLTALVGDMASIFGCLVGLKDSVTAITIVALGTSLPDLFASNLAAKHEPYADNSIGNVTGSNGVNVFLGLGIPWFIAAIYWKLKDEPFVVEGGDLAFSVTLYACAAIICIGILFARRSLAVLGQGELGGPKKFRYITLAIFVALWFFYILFSALNAYGHIDGF